MHQSGIGTAWMPDKVPSSARAISNASQKHFASGNENGKRFIQMQTSRDGPGDVPESKDPDVSKRSKEILIRPGTGGPHAKDIDDGIDEQDMIS